MPISLCYLHRPHYCRGQMLLTTPVYLSSESIAAQGVFVNAKISQSSSKLQTLTPITGSPFLFLNVLH